MLQNAIPSLHITERSQLPARPGIYFVYTPDYQLLYIGKADNLQKRWNSHHKYQYFIETSMQCRIGYFVLNSAESLNQVIDEFQSEPIETTTKDLVSFLLTPIEYCDYIEKSGDHSHQIYCKNKPS